MHNPKMQPQKRNIQKEYKKAKILKRFWYSSIKDNVFATEHNLSRVNIHRGSICLLHMCRSIKINLSMMQSQTATPILLEVLKCY
jgi:hypothetical protein